MERSTKQKDINKKTLSLFFRGCWMDGEYTEEEQAWVEGRMKMVVVCLHPHSSFKTSILSLLFFTTAWMTHDKYMNVKYIWRRKFLIKPTGFFYVGWVKYNENVMDVRKVMLSKHIFTRIWERERERESPEASIFFQSVHHHVMAVCNRFLSWKK